MFLYQHNGSQDLQKCRCIRMDTNHKNNYLECWYTRQEDHIVQSRYYTHQYPLNMFEHFVIDTFSSQEVEIETIERKDTYDHKKVLPNPKNIHNFHLDHKYHLHSYHTYLKV
jgi:hypothetical protein